MSVSDSSENVDLYQQDNTVIPARVVTAGKMFTGGDDETAVVKLQDTSVLRTEIGLHRAIAISTDSSTHYQELTSAQEEQIIAEACKRANLKVAFTRWLEMVKKDKYPGDATAEEVELFGDCLLSQTTVAARVSAKRKRDAASRKRRALHAAGQEPVAKRISQLVDQQPENAAATVDVRITGSASDVRQAMQHLLA